MRLPTNQPEHEDLTVGQDPPILTCDVDTFIAPLSQHGRQRQSVIAKLVCRIASRASDGGLSFRYLFVGSFS